jgi:hypothetical protein
MRYFWVLALFSNMAMASYVDLSANFWQNRQIYGSAGDSSNLSQTFSAGWSWFLWEMTAVEFMAQRQKSLITENDPVSLAANETVVSSRNEVVTDTFSLGFRQNLMPRDSVIVPAITFGYAKQVIESKTRYVIDDNGAVSSFILEDGQDAVDSCYVGGSLRFRLTRFLGLMSSFRSVMPKCDTSKITDNTQLTAGISWIF